MGFSKQEYWNRLPFPSPGESSQPRDRTYVSCFSCLGRWILYRCATWETLSWCLTHSKCWRIFATIDYDHHLKQRWDDISSDIQEAHIHGLCTHTHTHTLTYTHTHTHTHTHPSVVWELSSPLAFYYHIWSTFCYKGKGLDTRGNKEGARSTTLAKRTSQGPDLGIPQKMISNRTSGKRGRSPGGDRQPCCQGFLQ